MFVNIREAKQDAPRMLVVAPEIDLPGMGPLKATAADGELAALKRDATGLHVDALIGTVELTGPDDSLSDTLLAGNYTLMLIISHGNCDEVALTATQIPAHEFSRILSQHGIVLALIMTCDSLDFARALVAGGLARAIGTDGDIHNDDARVFSREFYAALGAGREVKAAVEYARSRMRSAAARQIVLLPDEDPQAPADPLLTEVRALRRELRQLAGQVIARFDETDRKMVARAEKTHADMRNLAAAMTNLMEVLSA